MRRVKTVRTDKTGERFLGSSAPDNDFTGYNDFTP
jgi:hypothetical protein